MKELIEKMARAIVDESDLVAVTEMGGDNTLILELKVAKADIGKVIGKKGRNVSALRTILNAVAAKERKRVILEVADE